MSLEKLFDVIELNSCFYVKYSHLRDLIIVRKTIMILNKAIKSNISSITLDFSDCKPPSFPNILISLSGIIHYYRDILKMNIVIKKRPGSYIDQTMIDNPYLIERDEKILKSNIYDKIVSFNSAEDIEFITENLLKQAQTIVVIANGVLVGSSWCLNEVMDNVLNHSNTSKGFIMAQIQKKNKHIIFSIFDYGCGIFNSFENSPHTPQNTIESIHLAVTKGITRDSKLGQGNGLWGLHSIVSNNKGSLTITTGNSKVIFDYTNENEEIKEHTKLAFLSKKNQTTLVDFMIDFENLIDVTKSLGGYEPYEKITRDIELSTDVNGWITLNVYKKAAGTGTRESGRRIRFLLLNTLNMEGKPIVLDFIDVKVLSSSFADEFIGKLVESMGIVSFNNCVRISNANKFIESIINKAIIERMQNKL